MSLCHSFQELARWTWRQLDRSYRLNSPFNEETITESILLELKDRHPNDVNVVSFSKLQERKIGADWEFWFVDQNKTSGTGWRVQAKRLYRPHERYDALKPKEVDRTSQIQTLIRMAKQHGLTPVYCFYNSVGDVYDIQKLWRCGSFRVDHEMFGCSVALAENVHALGSKKFDEVAKISMPWHCAVCCTVTSKPDDNFPDRVANATNNLLYSNFFVDDRKPTKPQDHLPKHVKLLLTNEMQQEALLSEQTFEEIMFQASEAEATGIRGIVVISEPIGSKDE